MGDISEIRGLLVVGTFLTITILLISWIPSDFYGSTEVYKQIEVPEEFDAIDVVQYASTYNFTFGDNAPLGEQWGKSEFGHDMHIYFYKPTRRILNEHYFGFLNLFVDRMHWINIQGLDRGDIIDQDEIEEDMIDYVANYKVECEHFYMYSWFAYNTTAYSSFTEAWDNDDAKVLFAIDFDQVGSIWNVWSIMSGVLFFNLPDVNIYVNALISVPIWIAIIYISYILVLRAIGAIFGGGGA